MKISRKELNEMAKEKRIPRYYDYTKVDLARKLGFEVEKVRTPNFSRADLDILAKESGIKNSKTFLKHELAEMLGIERPRGKRNQPKVISRKCRKVKIGDETYPSISLAAQATGVSPSTIYTLVERNETTFL